MLSVEEARETILSHITPLPMEEVGIDNLLGRTIAEDVEAWIDNPPFDNSAVDGYAVRADDVKPDRIPARLKQIGELGAGQWPYFVIDEGACARIMTGAALPDGAEAMVMVEDTTQLEDGYVEIREAARYDANIRRQGNDFKAGSVLVKAGTVITPTEISAIATAGWPSVSCFRRARVAVISTGDELVNLGDEPGPGQIYDSNRAMMSALVIEAGAELAESLRLRDDLSTTEAALSRLAGLDGSAPVDAIVCSGGVSVGDRDFVKAALERLGTLELWRVNMKPGKPLAYGKIADTHFFGLPGNPVSTFVTFQLFVRQALDRLAGAMVTDWPQLPVRLEEPLKHAPGRREYARAHVSCEEGVWIARPTRSQGSGNSSSLMGSNGLIVLPEESTGYAAGDTATALMFRFPNSPSKAI
jgi:molybdopterin molybdotransferase